MLFFLVLVCQEKSIHVQIESMPPHTCRQRDESTVEPVLEDHPISHKNVVSQDR